jgi:hypothetical protein
MWLVIQTPVSIVSIRKEKFIVTLIVIMKLKFIVIRCITVTVGVKLLILYRHTDFWYWFRIVRNRIVRFIDSFRYMHTFPGIGLLGTRCRRS